MPARRTIYHDVALRRACTLATRTPNSHCEMEVRRRRIRLRSVPVILG